jgi:hypothetical protein
MNWQSIDLAAIRAASLLIFSGKWLCSPGIPDSGWRVAPSQTVDHHRGRAHDRWAASMDVIHHRRVSSATWSR